MCVDIKKKFTTKARKNQILKKKKKTKRNKTKNKKNKDLSTEIPFVCAHAHMFVLYGKQA
jgi:hypothetical protein